MLRTNRQINNFVRELFAYFFSYQQHTFYILYISTTYIIMFTRRVLGASIASSRSLLYKVPSF